MTHIENTHPYTTTSQSGVTLMEMIAALAIIAVIIVGSLALYNAATSSQSSTQMVQDVTSLRAAVKQIYLGQGSYGTGDLSGVLVKANRLPSTIKAVTTTTAGENGASSTSSTTFKSVLNGDVTITGSGASFTIKVEKIPSDVCIPLLTNTTGWTEVDIGSTKITSFPVSAATAATDCGSGDQTITFTSN